MSERDSMGKTITVYLPNDSAGGIRHAEIANWSGQALACPRSRFQELRAWTEVQRPGVYLLFGFDEETGVDVAYIGEAEVVIDRLASHISGKDFWTEVVTFTSKDENLTKAHVKYLESRLVAMSHKAGRYRIENTANPQLPLLPRSARDAMEEFLESVKLLLGALGHKILEPLIAANPRISLPMRPIDPMASLTAKIIEFDPSKVIETSPIFHLKVGDIHARAVRTDEGVVVLEDSEAALVSSKSLTGGVVAKRANMIEAGMLAPFGRKLRLTRDYLFKSPSQAATVVVGYPINGRENWRLGDGTTYTQYEESLATSMLEELTTTN